MSNYSSVIFNLTELLQGKDFQWNEHAQEAFENIKTNLFSAPCLVYPDYDSFCSAMPHYVVLVQFNLAVSDQ